MNHRTYPNLLRLFSELDVHLQDSDMSFGVHCEGCGLEYAGSRGLAGVAPSLGTLARPQYLRMLAEIKLFHRHARQVLATDHSDRLTIGRFIVEGRYSGYFRDHFLLPLTGAIWSSANTDMLRFPARYLIRFFANHGMLTVKGSPQWKTVSGGSRVYVRRLVEAIPGEVRLGEPVTSLRRDSRWRLRQRRAVRPGGGRRAPRPGARAAGRPDADERRLLGAFGYSANETVLHTDRSLLPQASGARASWNYLLSGCRDQGPVSVTYHLNRLQALREPEDYCVTLNQTERIDPAARIRTMMYHHPVYTPQALAAQRRFDRLQGVNRTWYCGAYHGWGFHEDGCRSGAAVATAMGSGW